MQGNISLHPKPVLKQFIGVWKKTFHWDIQNIYPTSIYLSEHSPTNKHTQFTYLHSYRDITDDRHLCIFCIT